MTPPLQRPPLGAPPGSAAASAPWLDHDASQLRRDSAPPSESPEVPPCERKMEFVAGQSEITFQLLDGTQAAAHESELQALHAEVYAEQPYGPTDDGLFAGRFRVLRRQPGFVLAEARHGGYLIGYCSRMPRRATTAWRPV